MKNGLIPIPPPAMLQNKKAALYNVYELLPSLRKRVDAYAQLNTAKRSPYRQTPRPALKAIYTALSAYPLGLFPNPTAEQRPMVRCADSIVSDCLGLIDIGQQEGLFTPDDYQELAQRLRIARTIIDEVYYTQTQRPNPGKKGTRPNANRATPETRANAGLSVPGTRADELGSLLIREDAIQDALDDLATAIVTNDIADVSRLLGTLELYPFPFDDQPDEPSLLVGSVDWHVKEARRFVCEILCKPTTRQIALPRIQKGLSCGLQMVEELIVLYDV